VTENCVFGVSRTFAGPEGVYCLSTTLTSNIPAVLCNEASVGLQIEPVLAST
jgi:hypothetical protein